MAGGRLGGWGTAKYGPEFKRNVVVEPFFGTFRSEMHYRFSFAMRDEVWVASVGYVGATATGADPALRLAAGSPLRRWRHS